MFISLVGAPASGKSSWARELKEQYGHKVSIISSDAIREELYGAEEIQGNPEEIFAIAHKRIIESIEDKEINITVFDATNTKRKYRQAIMDKLKDYSIIKKCLIFAEPYDVLCKRNGLRDRKVPEEVIWRMLKNFEVPLYTEGYTDIRVVNYNNINMHEYLEYSKGFIQDNPHHSLDLYNHSIKAAEYIANLRKNGELDAFDSEVLMYAALLHDIGKIFTKTFTNFNGEESDVAHYYGHDKMSGYLSLVYNIPNFSREQCLIVAQLICYHMQPYFNKTEKSKEKWKHILGEDFYNLLLILHEADKNAH